MPSRSREILDAVRQRTGKTDLARYDEIDRAYRKICLITKFNWLQQRSESMLRFTQGRTDYPLDMTRMRRLERIWVLDTENEEGWCQLEEVKDPLFETRRVEFRDGNGDDEQDKPLYFKIIGGSVATVTITPTPDQTYSTRVDYLDFHKLSEEEEPRLSPVYDDTIAELASAYVLEMSKDASELQLGQKYEARAMEEFGDIVKDHAPNRTLNIDKVPQRWIK